MNPISNQKFVYRMKAKFIFLYMHIERSIQDQTLISNTSIEARLGKNNFPHNQSSKGKHSISLRLHFDIEGVPMQNFLLK